MAIKKIKRMSTPDWDSLMARTGGKLCGDGQFRRLLGVIHPKCYLEAEYTNQYGSVTKIIRDRYGVPVAAEVEFEERDEETEEVIATGKDCIAMADVTFWEPWNYDEPVENFQESEEWFVYYLEHGYEWDDEMEGYYNKETGDVVR